MAVVGVIRWVLDMLSRWVVIANGIEDIEDMACWAQS